MKKTLPLLLLVICLSAESQIKLMSYNMLNFPTGNIQGRVDTLKKIIDYYRPNLLMMQELKTAQGVQDVTDMMNSLGYGDFDHGTFVPSLSDNSQFALQQCIVFDRTKFRLKSQHEIPTVVRDFNEFVLYFNDSELANGADTTFINVYVTHLKSSTNPSNETLRLSMINTWRNYVTQNIPSDRHVILAGDFNLYSNSEAAYQAAIADTNSIVMRDVFADYGNWTGSGFAHKEILTQSTRVSQVASDGAGGGLDDRFDFILFSDNLMDQSGLVHYTPSTFKSLGNNATCYNQNITDCYFGNPVPLNVLQAMYYMSDHIPQVCELETSLHLGAHEITSIQNPILFPKGNIADQSITIVQPALCKTMIIYDVHGKSLFEVQNNADRMHSLNTSQLANGVYFVQTVNENSHSVVERFVVLHP